jgi:Spy/CpxP family protein refolding chaperone
MTTMSRSEAAGATGAESVPTGTTRVRRGARTSHPEKTGETTQESIMKGTMIAALAMTLGLAMLAPGGPARAQGPAEGPDPGPNAGPRMERRAEMRRRRDDMLRDLDLSKEQREKISDLREKQERDAIRMRADLQTARLDLRRMMRADKADRAAINRQIDQLAELRAQMEKARVSTLLDIRSVLTPEQLERVRQRERP